MNISKSIEARSQQIEETWTIDKNDWSSRFKARDLAEQEIWGVMSTYLSLVALIPAAAAAFFNPEVGGILIAADAAIGAISWIRSRQAITAVQQEQAARHL